MPPAARLGDETSHGTPLAPGPGSFNVLIGGQPAWRAEIDQHMCPAVNITGADGDGSVLMGSPTVLINGMMACRMGDVVVEKPGLALGPANPILMGCPTVMIGEAAFAPNLSVASMPSFAMMQLMKQAADQGSPFVSPKAAAGSVTTPAGLQSAASFAGNQAPAPADANAPTSADQSSCMLNAANQGAPFVVGASE